MSPMEKNLLLSDLRYVFSLLCGGIFGTVERRVNSEKGLDMHMAVHCPCRVVTQLCKPDLVCGPVILFQAGLSLCHQCQLIVSSILVNISWTLR